MTDQPGAVEARDVVAAPPGLVPPFAEAVMAIVGAHSTSPYEEERAAVTAASGRRRAEFFAGRACAHAAVRALGEPDVPIAVGLHREPLWPAGVVGSIAHGGRWCAAVVAPAHAAQAVGVDIEPLQPLPPDVERLVLTTEELRRLPTSSPLARFASTIAFSAKECVYKCLFPATGWALEFHDVSVEVDLARPACRAWLPHRWRRLRPDLGHLDGRFRVRDGHVFTLFWLP